MKEEEIRKRDVLNRYLELVEEDVKAFFDPGSFEGIACPACGGGRWAAEFEKVGFNYVSCMDCRTLYVNPRPGFETLKRFYSDSPSTSYWVNEFFKPVAEARRKMIFRPRAEHVRDLIGGEKGLVLGDVGAGFGLFLEELKALCPDNRYVCIEPSLEMADICRSKDLDVMCACLEEVRGMDGGFDFITVFELLEHLYDPGDFLDHVNLLLKPGGRLLFTSLSCYGFDIQILWERSKSVFPPHHLNFFNTDSVARLLESRGFEALEVSTPGQLDVDIVEGAVAGDGVDPGRFWRLFMNMGTREAKNELQAWIRRHGFSSHMRVLARKL